MPRASRSKTRAAHLGPERRRPQILNAALEIAVADGVGAVTIGAVAQRLEVTRPVVYSCFNDRVELIDELLTRESEALLANTLLALRSARGDDLETAFVHGYQALLKVVAEQPDSWRLLFFAQPDPAVSDRFAKARAVVAEHVSAQLRPVLDARGTRDLDRKLPVLVELFISSCEASLRSLLGVAGEWQPAELGELYGRAMWRAFSDV
ncbi:TetR/AcrR family transcriptional regulator [Hoyosella sp. YIM 151337]|uniref:TetR/AcrR family transcriptional regulator n=1 Tax=Hoyosella sp. YIM 151337 TaxID=2992742 RepID=UPI002235BC94|nr:TetR/AcrR family transcriptional regulator [Hoyosella sp. YIM 151337]MCW4353686.1 TetR/AcrR family transcriptional regulator [Hoyosella sp. YIM 151337]